MMKESIFNRIIRKLKKLPLYNNGIPEISLENYGGCLVTNSGGISILCSNGIVILYEKNIVEVKKDTGCTIENIILTSAPDEVHKEVYSYL